jgi:hypothetical protein
VCLEYSSRESQREKDGGGRNFASGPTLPLSHAQPPLKRHILLPKSSGGKFAPIMELYACIRLKRKQRPSGRRLRPAAADSSPCCTFLAPPSVYSHPPNKSPIGDGKETPLVLLGRLQQIAHVANNIHREGIYFIEAKERKRCLLGKK